MRGQQQMRHVHGMPPMHPIKLTGEPSHKFLLGQGTKSPFLHANELFVAFQATRMTIGFFYACCSLQHLLLQTSAAWGLQPKALQEAIVLRYCSFIVQMKSA
jgi:hypothetical protein